jgi:hypothetical protein
MAWSSLMACQEPGVDARAVWVDVVREGDGSRNLNIYERGERRSARLGSTFADVPSVHLQLGPRGRRAFLREPQLESVSVLDRAAVVDLDDGRTFYLEVPKATIDSDDPVSFSQSGGALLWRDAGYLSIFTLAPGVPVDQDGSGFHEPLRVKVGPNGWDRTASDAPVVFVHDVASRSLFSVGYPDGLAGGEELEELGFTRDDAGLLESSGNRAVPDCSLQIAGCEAFHAVDPGGWGITIRIEVDKKRWAHWSRRFPPEPLEELELPTAMDDVQGLAMLGAVDEGVLVFADDSRLFRWELRDDDVDVFPLVGDPGFSVRRADHGRVLLIISNDGAITRVDRDEIRLVNAARSACFMTSLPVVSPSGEWAAWACLDTEGDAQLDRGVVVRVSEGSGLRRYGGIVMGALAIDDSGMLLLQSEDSVVVDGVDGVEASLIPHSLYTLDGDDVLRRADDLEPSPEPIILPEGGLSSYLQARALGD